MARDPEEFRQHAEDCRLSTEAASVWARHTLIDIADRWHLLAHGDLLLKPDVITETSHTICFKGMASPVVCTAGAKLC